MESLKLSSKERRKEGSEEIEEIIKNEYRISKLKLIHCDVL